jgi:hypothetical protein
MFLAFLTLAHRLNINFGIAFKLGKLGNGPLSSYMNYVASGAVILIVFIGKKAFWGRESIRSTSRK